MHRMFREFRLYLYGGSKTIIVNNSRFEIVKFIPVRCVANMINGGETE